jgi:3-phytase/alkaline phosphatase D
LCELDRDSAAETVELLAERYLAVGQSGQSPIGFGYRFCGDVNTGMPTGRDVDGDGADDGPADAQGFGRFPGQHGMAVLSRHPILIDRVRTFQKLPWHRMPGALRPPDFWPDETWRALRLSSKSHWDVPIGIGPVDKAQVVHFLCSHPTPPAFDGPEDRSGRRNHDEIRFWVDYLTPGRDGWSVDDAGVQGGLPAGLVLLFALLCELRPRLSDSAAGSLGSLLDRAGNSGPHLALFGTSNPCTKVLVAGTSGDCCTARRSP